MTHSIFNLIICLIVASFVAWAFGRWQDSLWAGCFMFSLTMFIALIFDKLGQELPHA